MNRLAASWTDQVPASPLSGFVAMSARQVAPTRTAAATTPAVMARPGRRLAQAVRPAAANVAVSPLTGARLDASTQLACGPSWHRGSTRDHRADPRTRDREKQGRHARPAPVCPRRLLALVSQNGRRGRGDQMGTRVIRHPGVRHAGSAPSDGDRRSARNCPDARDLRLRPGGLACCSRRCRPGSVQGRSLTAGCTPSPRRRRRCRPLNQAVRLWRRPVTAS